ncbi:DUF5018 domain-containing protein [Reichenbachiella agarivorans]|uniref:DUF5018 domain-containing protein n=1 Tax=Reichenbachiella agarivorans TaxID=2979464 RepID=A0ABY6CNC3_9BACT|nr:DUF5018 domain-containing protein [Reichenbachiella agarivorans]UXP32015.1 DUF5018 domain-containing protein [Reichenbachiella agarivorans]
MKKILYRFSIVLLSTILIVSCGKDDDPVDEKSSAKSITAFSVSTVSAEIVESNRTISISLPYGTDITALTPTIAVSPEALVSPESGVVQDFTDPVLYEVTAEDGSQQTYTVTASVEASEGNEILSFDLNELSPAVIGEVDLVNNTVVIIVPKGTDLTQIVPTISISDEATVSPESGVATNFSEEVTYTVTSQSGDKAEYSVMVSFEKNDENAITEFKFEEFTPDLVGEIDQEAKTVSVTIPWDAEFDFDYDIFSLIPTVVVSEGATVDPASGVSANFNYERTFNVTAENGDVQLYTINVERETAPEATIDALTVTEYSIGDFITISGENFTKDCRVILGATTTSSIVSDITSTSFKIEITSFNFSVGDVVLKVKVRDQEFVLGTISILPPAPSINQFVESTSDGNKILRLIGTNFVNGKNEVYFVSGANEELANIKSESLTSVYVVIPPFIETGDYQIKVVSLGGTFTSSATVSVTQSVSIEPVITGVNKTTIGNGETLEIYGKNFKNVGGGVTIGWLDGNGPTKNLTGIVVSSEKIEVVINRTTLSSNLAYEFYLQWPGLEYSENFFYNIKVIN